jgi:two-component system cell cycle sensor histidine kinase PleC
MFSHLKLFSIISLSITVVITVILGALFRDVAINYLSGLIEKNNVSIAEGYVEAVWHDNAGIIPVIKTKSSEQLNNDLAIQQFVQETRNYFKKTPIIHANLYSTSGDLILSIDVGAGNALAGDVNSFDINFVSKQLLAISASNQIISNAVLKNGAKVNVIQTIVPIIPSNKNSSMGAEGVLELTADFDDSLEKVKYTQTIVSGYIVGICLLFLALLSIVSKRAEIIIAKQHESNIELIATAAAAQNESRDKSQFLANVSHELRTPLNAIIGFSEIIKNNLIETMDQQKLDDYINDIHASGIHLLSLINDILDYSKAEAGKLELEISEINANKLVHNCLRLVSTRAEKAEVTLLEAMPKKPLNVVTDSKKFKQILLNLLSNAIKFTPQGGVVRISAWVDVIEKSYVFEVRDSGIGIAAKDISRAMSPFGQVDSALSRKYEGTGLGLPLTKKFVEVMGGKFTITSEVGKGTTITFSLPQEIPEMEGLVVKPSEI